MIDDTKPKFRVLAAGAEKSVLKAAEEKEEAKRGNWFVKRIVPLVAGLALVGAPVANISCSGSVPVVEDADAQTNVEGNAEDGMEERDSEVDADESEEYVGDVADAPEEADVAEEQEEDGNSEVDADESEEEDSGEETEDAGPDEVDSCTPIGPYEEVVESPMPDVRNYLGGSIQVQIVTYNTTENCDGTIDRETVSIEYVFTPPLNEMGRDEARRRGILTAHTGMDAVYRVTEYDENCLTYSMVIDGRVLVIGAHMDYVQDDDYYVHLRSGMRMADGRKYFDFLLRAKDGSEDQYLNIVFEGENRPMPNMNRVMPTAAYVDMGSGNARVDILRPELEDILVCDEDTVVRASDGMRFTFHMTPTGWIYIAE